MVHENESGEPRSKAARREITAAGATEGTERQQERQRLNVGIMPSRFSVPRFLPTSLPRRHRSFSLSSFSVSLGSRFASEREGGRERRLWREHSRIRGTGGRARERGERARRVGERARRVGEWGGGSVAGGGEVANGGGAVVARGRDN